jgi:hypothetical protein
MCVFSHILNLAVHPYRKRGRKKRSLWEKQDREREEN